MTQPTENQKYEKRFEDALVDVQYMLDYASGKSPDDIHKVPIRKLIHARHRVEKGEELSVDEEADFWFAYQELWKLIQPATAESVRANYQIEETIVSKLFGNIPILSRWLGKWTTSKSRRTVNRYVVFTVLVLLLVLFFQIYWVIGNQLSAQLDKLLEAERELSIQISENVQSNTVVSTQLNQDSTQTQATGLEKKLQSLESQLVQTSVIFLNWSSPWNGLITKGGLEHSGKYESQLRKIDTRIAEIDLQLSIDPDGMKAAESNEVALSAASGSDDKNIQTKLKLVRKKSTLEAELTYLNDKELSIQAQIEELQNQKSTLEQELIELDGAKTISQRDLIDQKNALAQELNGIEEQLPASATAISIETPSAETSVATDTVEVQQLKTRQESIQVQLDYIDNLLSTNPDFNLATVSQNSILADQAAQLSYIAANQSFIQGEVDIISAQLEAIEQATINGLDELTTLLNDPEMDNEKLQKNINEILDPDLTLQAQLTGVNAVKELLQVQIESLQVQIDSLQIDTEKSPQFAAQLQNVAAQIVTQLNQEKQSLVNERETLLGQAQVASIREDSGPAQLAGRFVLDILQSYVLPLFYGILGAATYVLRSLSRQIKSVTYSEVSGLQHLSHISLGALAGILVGWFSFLVPSESFIGSVSPLAIAFLVGYNIELFFSKMDEFVVTRLREIRQRTLPGTEEENQKVDSVTAPTGQPTQETNPREGSAAEAPAT